MYRSTLARLARLALWGRSASTWIRSTASTAIGRIGALRGAPPRAGITGGRVASLVNAQEDLQAISESPVVYAAMLRRALTFATYPIRVYQGYSIGGRKATVLDPERVPWVGSLLRLLQCPDPDDQDGVFPANPGESLLAQIVADLILTGNAWVAIRTSPSGAIVGLYRLHPRCVTLERFITGDEWVYRPGSVLPTRYPRRTVAHLKLLSWQASAAGELGTGAGAALRQVIDAETTALNQTANMIRQGGADVKVTGTSALGKAFLANEKNRKEVAKEVSEAMKGPEGRRVFVLGGDLDVNDSGLKPADLKAPEMMVASRGMELAAIGTVPVALGSDAGTYATAVQQYRTQAELDEQIAAVIEACLLRPLARHFARMAGGRAAVRADEYTARFDLSSHPGYAFLRSEQVNRMVALVNMGWAPHQAAEAEGLDMPEPEGEPKTVAPTTPPSGGPRSPLGDNTSRKRSLDDLFPTPPVPPSDRKAQDRQRAWEKREAARTQADQELQGSAQKVLDVERERYAAHVGAQLAKHEPRAAKTLQRVDWPAIDLDSLLPKPQPGLYTEGMGSDWLSAWDRACASALDGVDGGDRVKIPGSTPATLQPLDESSADMAGTTWGDVRAVVQRGLADGKTMNEIQADIRAAGAFNDARALRIARTESVRAQSSGNGARYDEAQTAGLDLELEWMAGTYTESQRPEHRALDGATIPVGSQWTFADGVTTRGPGLSGDPAHDCNCRCGERAKLKG